MYLPKETVEYKKNKSVQVKSGFESPAGRACSAYTAGDSMPSPCTRFSTRTPVSHAYMAVDSKPLFTSP